MECPVCKFNNPKGATRCENCQTPLEIGGVTTTGVGAEGWSMPAPPRAAAGERSTLGGLQPGVVLGDRYEIIQLLGEGGMGAVYKVRDREVDRLVALKVIRPELTGQPDILKRFKQELILARRITHKNVIRIFDLGQAEGLKFITMEYVEGHDLKALLRDRHEFTVPQIVQIIQQVARALDAAHSEGVIHRDLKPQNIMVDDNEKVVVMDFGIARTMEQSGLTMTGALVGTPEYMSPEQAKGEKIDTRSDLFALGIIFYELLTRKPPYHAETAMGTLLKRVQEAPASPQTINRNVPPFLNDVVMKCLAIKPADRYQTAQELLNDLEFWQGGGRPLQSTVTQLAPPVPPAQPSKLPWKWIGAGMAVVLLAAGAFLFRDKFTSKPAGPHKPVSVLVADFTNATGDPVFDRTLEPTFITDLEGASFITAYDRGGARRIAAKLRPGAMGLDEALAKLVALREGVHYVVTGSIDSDRSSYRLTIRAISAPTGKAIAAQEVSAADKQGVLRAVGKLAARVRTALGDDTPEALQLAAADTFTAVSLEAAQAYAAAKEFEVAGKKQDAIAAYRRAIELDPNLGRAYAGLAVADVNLREHAQAGENFKKALALLDRMSEREKYRTLGIYYLSFVRNYQQATETYRKLVSLYPGDGAGYNNLAIAYAFTGNVPEALKAGRAALDISPNNLQRRLNFAIYRMFSGDFDACIAETDRILKENPGYDFAYLPLALSTLAKGDVKGAREVYARLEALGPHGFSLAKIGEADLDLYLGRNQAALQALQPGIAADEKEKNAGEMALKEVAQGEADLALGRRPQAIEAAEKATGLNQTESALFLAGRLLAEAGADEKARKVAASLENLLQSQTKSYALLISGEIALQHKRFPDAVDAFREGQKLQDSWMSHFLLGRAYAEAGHFAEALAELEICRKRKGETADIFFSDMTTLRYLPPLYYWLGRAQEGVGTTDLARSSYQEFLKLRTDADPDDPLVRDAKRRTGG